MSEPSTKWLRRVAWAETASLLALLVNLATVHVAEVAALLGPLHGCCYLATICTALLVPLPRPAVWLTLVPGIGGLLALRAARTRLPVYNDGEQ